MISVPASESQLKGKKVGVGGERLSVESGPSFNILYFCKIKNIFHSHWRKIWFTQFLA